MFYKEILKARNKHKHEKENVFILMLTHARETSRATSKLILYEVYSGVIAAVSGNSHRSSICINKVFLILEVDIFPAKQEVLSLCIHMPEKPLEQP